MQTEAMYNIVDEGYGYTLTITNDVLSGSNEFELIDDSGEDITDEQLLSEIFSEIIKQKEKK